MSGANSGAVDDHELLAMAATDMVWSWHPSPATPTGAYLQIPVDPASRMRGRYVMPLIIGQAGRRNERYR